MKQKIITFAEWSEEHWIALVIILSVVMMIFLFLILGSWLAGYWLKALYGMNFELGSCWQGVTAVATGLATIISLGGACWAKYRTDSKYNSPLGQPVINKMEMIRHDSGTISK
ncbi:hypothetical protein AB840_14660 [Megasphaera cerevisiae DSM 20462]|uniref:Uncharacterized protein n=1 Tax=Megasphaera cerevisiae DSM 20462 TaxID=1122219 RepID=A0A0J6WTZ4_9FIRM|nr:hypothetical protein AB840_14660 [Megasphaera cerevisiae DSM 20462]